MLDATFERNSRAASRGGVVEDVTKRVSRVSSEYSCLRDVGQFMTTALPSSCQSAGILYAILLYLQCIGFTLLGKKEVRVKFLVMPQTGKKPRFAPMTRADFCQPSSIQVGERDISIFLKRVNETTIT